ncbi:MAG: ABC transporter permease [Alphaproteobacteria bacterium]|nr:ABC transporter permease [Alphaproteobacteria bacterium]MBM4437309.1 ABC transporter permease [Actinomycetota bacterium]
MIFRLALRSLANRWATATLTALAIAVSVTLFLGVEKVRNGARASFANTISGTDLIVGARSGPVNLLLYSVFRIGNATNNIWWTTVQDIAARPEIEWLVPLSLGDSHFGFRIVGTTPAYFEYYRYRRDRALEFRDGAPFADLFEAVVGADVAAAFGYDVGDRIVIAHGLGNTSFALHDDRPFTIAGILRKTGTPVDRSVHVGLEAITAIHVDWQAGARIPGLTTPAERLRQMDLTPKDVTAVLIGLKSRLTAFRVQRAINEFAAEPLTAVLPGVALQELWGLIGTAESALAIVSALTVVTALLGMAAMLLATLGERRREMAILRSVGAGPRTILGLLTAEALILTSAGALVGIVLLYIGLAAARPWVDSRFGLYIPLEPPHPREMLALIGVIGAGVVAAMLPAVRAYRLSLADGMMVRT